MSPHITLGRLLSERKALLRENASLRAFACQIAKVNVAIAEDNDFLRLRPPNGRWLKDELERARERWRDDR